jgi:hypothetical protein
VTAFISSRLDCCNATLYGLAASNLRLQQVVMNATARLVTDTGRYEHIAPVLCDTLHWLPVQQQIIFKIAVLAFHCVRGTCPAYFNDVCVPLAAIPGRTNLRRVAAPTVWNSLPLHLHNATISERQFRSALKTHLFNLAYK